MRIVHNDYLTMLSRLVIGIMLIYASFYKIIEPASFAKAIWYYHLVPGNLINLMALILPWLELICGLGLILGIFYQGAKVWTALMMVMFMIALASTIVRGIDIDCGCFKASQGATGSAWNSLIFDLVAMLFVIQMMISKSRRWLICP
ncbi:MAG: DoxX family membrane protein [bacterium]|nr:DoxX family membrane protein [bacterium]